mgnify:CR=1 FL=1
MVTTRPPLALRDIPKASGPATNLFNGEDLNDWRPWLGYADPALTYKRPAAAPLGLTPLSGEIFKVVVEDAEDLVLQGTRGDRDGDRKSVV